MADKTANNSQFICPHCIRSFTMACNRDRHVKSRCKVLNQTKVELVVSPLEENRDVQRQEEEREDVMWREYGRITMELKTMRLKTRHLSYIRPLARQNILDIKRASKELQLRALALSSKWKAVLRRKEAVRSSFICPTCRGQFVRLRWRCYKVLWYFTVPSCIWYSGSSHICYKAIY
jgi:predicted RNA-binding Zn-ribbon protein involved in translation (DUF1610 family)